MVELIKQGVYLINGNEIRTDATGLPTPDEARENTITYGILRSHDVDGSKGKKMRIRFDAMMSHDITYVGIIQTARASGLEKFPLPYAMTNCHNSLCAVGGTINEDDHVFGLSAAKKYGGIYVPANQAVIHQFAREAMVKCGNMILVSGHVDTAVLLGSRETEHVVVLVDGAAHRANSHTTSLLFFL